MSIPACPDRARLREYLHGHLQFDDSDAVEQHLASCDACDAIACELDHDDDWLTRLLRASAIDPAESEERPSWISAVRSSILPNVPSDSQDSESPIGDIHGKTVGAYKLVEVIGRGGMGIVCRAIHQHLGRVVAIKLILKSTAANAAERFEREMRSIGALHHPAIVQATDAGTADGRAYLAMELIDGIDLCRLLPIVGPLPVGAACAIIRQVALGLHVAHQAGIVHRDVKPSNIMLSRAGQVKILDFGLALAEESVEASCQTSVGRLLGTLDYLAPEQTDGSTVDARADIYSLGATLFTLLAGRPPLGKSAELPLLQHLRRLALEDAPSIADFRADVPGPLVELLARMLSRDPAARPHSANEVADRLRVYEDDSNLSSIACDACQRRRSAALLNNSHQSGAVGEHTAAAVHRHDSQSRSVPATVRPGGLRRAVRRLAAVAGALALLAAGSWLGVVIVLNTGEGQLRIESQTEDVSVRVLRDEVPVDTFAIKQGTRSVKLRAGKYEVQIDGAADELVVSDKEVRILRNEETVVTITRARPIATADRGPAASTERMDADLSSPSGLSAAAVQARLAALTSAPVWNGKGPAEWLEVLRTDLQPDRQQEALDALLAIASNLDAQIRAEVLLIVGQHALGPLDDPRWRSLLVAAEAEFWKSSEVKVPEDPAGKWLSQRIKGRGDYYRAIKELTAVPHAALERLIVPVMRDGDAAMQAILLRSWLKRGLAGNVTTAEADAVERSFQSVVEPQGDASALVQVVLLSLPPEPPADARQRIEKILSIEPTRNSFNVAIAMRLAHILKVDVDPDLWCTALATTIAYDEFSWQDLLYHSELLRPRTYTSNQQQVIGNFFVEQLVPRLEKLVESPDFEKQLFQGAAGKLLKVLLDVCHDMPPSKADRERVASLLHDVTKRLVGWRDRARVSEQLAATDVRQFYWTIGKDAFLRSCDTLAALEGELPSVLQGPIEGEGDLPQWFNQWWQNKELQRGIFESAPQNIVDEYENAVALLMVWYPQQMMQLEVQLFTGKSANGEKGMQGARRPRTISLLPVTKLAVAAAMAGRSAEADAALVHWLLDKNPQTSSQLDRVERTFRSRFDPANSRTITSLGWLVHPNVPSFAVELVTNAKSDRLKAAGVATFFVPVYTSAETQIVNSAISDLVSSDDLPVALTAILWAQSVGLWKEPPVRAAIVKRLMQDGFAESSDPRSDDNFLLQRLVLLNEFKDEEIRPAVEQIAASLSVEANFWPHSRAISIGFQSVNSHPIIYKERLIRRFPDVAAKYLDRIRTLTELYLHRSDTGPLPAGSTFFEKHYGLQLLTEYNKVLAAAGKED